MVVWYVTSGNHVYLFDCDHIRHEKRMSFLSTRYRAMCKVYAMCDGYKVAKSCASLQSQENKQV